MCLAIWITSFPSDCMHFVNSLPSILILNFRDAFFQAHPAVFGLQMQAENYEVKEVKEWVCCELLLSCFLLLIYQYSLCILHPVLNYVHTNLQRTRWGAVWRDCHLFNKRHDTQSTRRWSRLLLTTPTPPPATTTIILGKQNLTTIEELCNHECAYFCVFWYFDLFIHFFNLIMYKQGS